MRVLIAPDKFKGTLTAAEVCKAITMGIHDYDRDIELVAHPLADGGEGTLDLLEGALNLTRVPVKVKDPLCRTIDSYYLKGDSSAFIEMAMASGLQLLKPQERNPLKTSTYGTGELIRDAIEKGAKHIYLMIGGSATNDGGAGMAEALGYIFSDKSGIICSVTGETLGDLSGLSNDTGNLLHGISVTVLTDVQNKLLGPEGATYVYGRQKGADEDMLVTLENNLEKLVRVLGNGLENTPGAGAAGGLGYGTMSFLGAALKSGIETIMEITDFEKKLAGVDLIISGEGKMDLQTVEGKVISGVSAKSREYGIPFSVICGMVEEIEKVQGNIRAHSIYPLVNEQTTSEEAMTDSFNLVRERAFRLIKEFVDKK